jgi:glycerate-2-kinase
MCIIAGGETTVTLKGGGLGGRNQEIALSAAIEIEGCQNCYIFSLTTDGEDGPTDCAGAWVDGKTITQAQERGLDSQCYLEQNNAYHFLEASNSLIKTGPTGTNVNDIVLLFIL